MPHELPARPDVEHFRKQAKSLVRAYRGGDVAAVARAHAVLGRRADERFQLSDAQYVIAVEHGYASWAAFKGACEATGLAGLAVLERGRLVLDSGLHYTEGKPVEVFVKKRLHRWFLDDDATAVRLAGKPAGWFALAEEVVEGFWLNINRRGVVFVGTVDPSKLGWLASRVAETSLAVYEALLELDD